MFKRADPVSGINLFHLNKTKGMDDQEGEKLQWFKQQGLLGISYVVWSLVGCACLASYVKLNTPDIMRFPFATFALSVANASLGVTEFFSDDIFFSLRILLELMLVLIGMPSVTTELWLEYKMGQKEMAWFHTGVGLIPLYIYLIQHYTRQDLVDFSVILNVISLAFVGVYKMNVYAFCTSVSFFFAYCILHSRQNTHVSYEFPTKQLFNYVMAVFTFLAFKAVTVVGK